MCTIASTDSVDFLQPIQQIQFALIVCNVDCRSSLRGFVKIIAENLKSGERKIAATALLTFVALNEQKKPIDS